MHIIIHHELHDGSLPKQMKFRNTLTLTTQSGFLCCSESSQRAASIEHVSIAQCGWTTLITDTPAILNRWAEHFSAVLNRPADINAEAIARLPQVETNTDLDRPPSEEVKKAIKQLSTGKAPAIGANTCHPCRSIDKHGGDTLLLKLTDLSCRMWDEEVIPQQLKDASIIDLYKKGNRQLCDN